MSDPNDPEQLAEVNIGRINHGEEITITLTFPRTPTAGKRRVYVTMTAHDFALALTGRGGLMGTVSQFDFGKSSEKRK